MGDARKTPKTTMTAATHCANQARMTTSAGDPSGDAL
jgi:hypothetical protein